MVTLNKIKIKLDVFPFYFYFSMSSKDSGIFFPLVSGRKRVRKPEVMAMTVKMRVGMAGWMSARAATVVDRVPPILETNEEEPTPAALTVVGISSPDDNFIKVLQSLLF